jgi:ubiquinone/menaquinone biosynthesis C-methylase UbiE
MSQKHHWEKAYSGEETQELGWYARRLQASLDWILDLGLSPDASIIDAGGGASNLVDDLLEAGFGSITVVDISGKSLSSAKTRLGSKAEQVKWLVGDITSIDLPAHQYDLWHDRASFHFLTELQQQRKYRDKVLQALKPGGHLIIGTFAPEAPPKCSGLPVQRYTRDQLINTLGEEFELLREKKELHITPGGVKQTYLYCQFQRAG